MTTAPTAAIRPTPLTDRIRLRGLLRYGARGRASTDSQRDYKSRRRFAPPERGFAVKRLLREGCPGPGRGATGRGGGARPLAFTRARARESGYDVDRRRPTPARAPPRPARSRSGS